MKNFLGFLKHLFLASPHDDFYSARLSLKADLAWQPYLHVAVFWGTVLTVVFGDHELVPPIDGGDWIWVIGGILSPPLGFYAVWCMKYGSSKSRYRAFWLRMASNIGLATTLLGFEIDSIYVLQRNWHPLNGVLVLAAAIFLLVLILRDAKFLVIAERVAHQINL